MTKLNYVILITGFLFMATGWAYLIIEGNKGLAPIFLGCLLAASVLYERKQQPKYWMLTIMTLRKEGNTTIIDYKQFYTDDPDLHNNLDALRRKNPKADDVIVLNRISISKSEFDLIHYGKR